MVSFPLPTALYGVVLLMAAYAAAIPLACVTPWMAIGLYVFVALLWLVPDGRIESRIGR